jgi:CHAT domain-containing protein
MDKSTYKSLKFSELKLSLETLYICDSLIDDIRQHRTNESDKIAMGISAAKVYETGVMLCQHMAYESIKKEPFYEQSFYFAEKSKSAVLLEAIADASAKSFAGIPDNELAKENSIKASIAYYEQELAKKPEEAEEKQLREALFHAKQNYESLIKELEVKYPKYYDLKYNVNIPSISQIQATLDDKTALYSYFIGSRSNKIIVYQITKNGFTAESRNLPDDFDNHLNGYLNAINYQVFDLYLLTAQTLFKVFFPTAIPKGIERLIIIPAGKVGTIPFGALITDKVKTKTEDYTILPYLGNKYAIGYQYASTLYYYLASGTQISTNANTVFLCAPVNFKTLPDLPGTSEEIANLQKIFAKKSIATEVYLENDAVESIIKTKDMHNYRYIHFATHGLVNEASPELSRLSLFEIEGDSEDGSLFSGEIYNLDLSAQLVTLSACETGLGKISEGEGIIGLSRAFAYAGANNILVSLWSVSDRSTAQLMIDFYDAIENENYSKALQKAQSKLIAHPIYSKPFYWAPFIIVGQ